MALSSLASHVKHFSDNSMTSDRGMREEFFKEIDFVSFANYQPSNINHPFSSRSAISLSLLSSLKFTFFKKKKKKRLNGIKETLG